MSGQVDCNEAMAFRHGHCKLPGENVFGRALAMNHQQGKSLAGAFAHPDLGVSCLDGSVLRVHGGSALIP
jgi:hypothetical protein